MPTIQIDNNDFFYEETGNGEPLLITTGWALAERAFVQHRELFAGRYRCIRHDHRGMGRSTAQDAPMTIAMMADDLAALLDHLDLEGVRVLGGGGMGGLVGMELAINHPHKVRSLHLGAPCLKVDAFLASLMRVWKDLHALDPALWSREVTNWCYTPATFDNNPDMAEAGARARAGENTFPQPYAYGRIIDAYLAFDATDRADRIACPVQISTGGSQDMITGPRFAEAVHAAIPSSELHIFEDCSHNYWVEDQDRFGHMILDWFDRT